MSAKIRCYEIEFGDYRHTINAPSAARARYLYWRGTISDCMDISFGDFVCQIKTRAIGGPKTTDQFRRNAAYRGMPDVECGQRVKVGEAIGTIVGHNSSANFNVCFDSDSPKYAGLQLNVHPHDVGIIS